MKIYIINGPNLNMLGIREPDHYGTDSYTSLVEKCERMASSLGIELEFFQSNHEGAIVDKIQEAFFKKADAIVINPAAYTHTSVAILDALKAVNLPFAEVHISKLEEREDFRQTSYIRAIAAKTITGHGTDGYTEAIAFLAELLAKDGNNES